MGCDCSAGLPEWFLGTGAANDKPMEVSTMIASTRTELLRLNRNRSVIKSKEGGRQRRVAMPVKTVVVQFVLHH